METRDKRSPTPVIEVRNLVKHYPQVQAVNGIDLTIREGICFGLLGPNGAGKTTTIEIIEGITKATSGELLYRGEPIGAKFRQKAGIQFQKTALQDYLTVREALELFRSFYEDRADLDELVRLCALEEFLDRDSDRLSGGQRQRVLLAIALVNNPDVIFLDEPTTGMDPQARRNFWDLIRAIKRQGRTIVLTTHYMEEAYALCDEIAVMDHGKIIAHGAPDHLLKKHFEGVSIGVPREDLSGPLESLPWPVTEKDGVVEIQTSDVNAVLKHLISRDVNLSRMRLRSPGLEDLFLELTGKQLRG